MRTKVLVLCGGRSEEHEISLISAGCVLKAIDRKQFEPILVGISRRGVWHLVDESSYYVGEFRADKIKLNTDTPQVAIVPYTVNSRGRLLVEGKTVEFDVVFPILHGQFGEDGTLQGLLDMIGIPYVGSGCESSALCMDKVLTKTLCSGSGIPVAEYVWVNDASELSSKKSELEKLGLPLFVKPSRQGSSVGVAKVKQLQDLPQAVTEALKHDTKVLIERGIQGRELECSVLGTSRKSKASVPGEILPNPKIGWYSYEAKYLLDDGAETVVPADLSSNLQKQVQELAIRAFALLECRGLARIDMFLEQTTQKLYINEINTMPGFTPISMYPKMWQASGLEYAPLLTELIQLALAKSPSHY